MFSPIFPTIHPILPAAPKPQRRRADPVEFKRYNRIQFLQHEIDSSWDIQDPFVFSFNFPQKPQTHQIMTVPLVPLCAKSVRNEDVTPLVSPGPPHPLEHTRSHTALWHQQAQYSQWGRKVEILQRRPRRSN